MHDGKWRFRFAACIAVVFAAASLQAQRRPDYNFYDSRTWHRASAPPAASAVRRALAAEFGDQVTAVPHQSGGSIAEIYRLAGTLTLPAAADPETVARAFLESHRAALGLAGASVFSLPLERRIESPAAGLTHLVFQQQYAGIGVFGGEVRVHLTRDGGILRVQSGTGWPSQANPALVAPLGAADALAAAARVLLPGASGEEPTRAAALGVRILSPESGVERQTVLAAGGFADPIPAKLVWFPRTNDVVLAWELYLHIDSGRWYCAVVDAATGELLFSHNIFRDQNPRGSVFRAADVSNPSLGAQTVENFTGWPAAEGNCPASIYPPQYRSGPQASRCWVSGTQTAGNNVVACLDASGTNQCDWQASNAQADFEFAFTNSYAANGNPVPDQSAAVTNLFYWNNVIHDWLYSLGFDEASGNFQADNFGRGGFGGDPVLADAQDGSGLNNSNFATPPDGASPRMQIFLFTNNGTYVRRDADFDGDVITHEYVHGLTTRLVGGAGNVNVLPRWQSGGMGEGWSDAYACSLMNNPVFAPYISAMPSIGIRSVAYNNSPYTFGQFGTLYRSSVGAWLLDLPEVHRDGEIWASLLWDLRTALGKAVFEPLVTTALKLTPPRPSMIDARNAILQAGQVLGVSSCDVWTAFARRGLGASAALNHVEAGEPDDTALSVYEAYDLPSACGGSPPAPGATIFSDDMESGASGWTATGLWHLTTRRAASGAHSWWYGQEATGNYATGSANNGSLTSPPIAIPAGAKVILEWDQYFQGEGFGRCYPFAGQGCNPYVNYDSGWVKVSTNSGSTWSTLTTLAHNSDRAAFDHYKLDLSRFAGNTILVRFYFNTLDSVANTTEGWYIDNVVLRTLVTGVPVLDVTPVALSFLAGAGSASTLSQTLNIANSGAGFLSWSVSASSSGWLTVAPSSGSGNAALTVTAAPGGLPPGSYNGTITVTAPGAVNSPAVVPVTLTIAAPVAEWHFEESGSGPGLTLADSSGNGHNGVTHGYGSIAAAGVAGSARVFNGFTDWADMEASSSLSPASFTFRAWIKLLSYPASAGWGVIAAAYGGNYQGWYVGATAAGRVIFSVASLPASSPWLVSNGSLALGRWYCITATYDGTTKLGTIYINGALDAQAGFPGFTPAAVSLTMGRASWFDGYYLNAAIDEARLLGQSQAAALVLADYQSFPATAAPPANTSVVADWRFDDPGGSLADSSGNAHNGVIQGATSDTGVLNLGRSFDGLTDSAVVPASESFGPSSFTVRFWLKLATYPQGWGVAISDYGGNYQGWYVGVHSSGRIIFSAAALPASSPWLLSTSSLELHRWYYVAATWDGAARLATIYIDGAADAQLPLAGFTPSPSTSLYFGRASWYDGYYLNASLDEACLWPAAKSPAEIADDFHTFPAQNSAGAVAEWKFDDTGSAVTDSSGNGHTGTPHGTTTVGAVAGAGRSFNGASDWVDVPASAALSPASFTLRAWIKLLSLPPAWGAAVANYSGDYQGWYLGIHSSGRVIFSVSSLPASSPWLISSTALFPNTWYHITVTYNGATRAGTIYIDGQQDAQAVFPGFSPQSAADLTLGRASWYDGYYLNMVLDEVRLLGFAQSPAQVQADFQSFP